MAKEIYVNVSSQDKRVVVADERRIEEFYIERADSVNLVGNIYKGRVESVVGGIDAAFIEMGLEKNGFLYVSDVLAGVDGYDQVVGDDAHRENRIAVDRDKPLPSISKVLKKGDEVIVQVVKEPIRTKGARLTTHVSIPGRFLVLMPFDQTLGISKRIEDRAERDRIRKIMIDLKLPKEYGFIVRTAAIGANDKDFRREVNYLLRLWSQIKVKAKRARPPSLIHQEYDLVMRVARDVFTGDIAKMEIDSKLDFKRVSWFLKTCAPHLRGRLRFYRERVPLFEKFGIEERVDKIYERTVHLKSGGSLVFDEAESLVAIDVNSGKSVREKNLEETAFKTNMEAAEEIPRQLKLRDLGGIIIIDFIDMESHGHRKSVNKALELALEDDKAKSKILNISSIGLVEMTRQRMRRSVEGKSNRACPYCTGRGTIKSPSTVSIEAIRRLENKLNAGVRAREMIVKLHPDVAAFITAPERNMIRQVERRFHKPIRVVAEQAFHREEFVVEEGR